MISIRPYRASDRQSVREICFATGYMGEPAAWYWRDFASFADVWSGYYTDHEPESLFVATEGERVVGYLLGCVDSARAPSPRAAITRALGRRALLLRPGTAGFFWRSIADSLSSAEVPSGGVEDPRWPAHLHTNLLPQARGRGAGGALMRAWRERLRLLGSPGCHLATLAENTRAIGFFEHSGFRRHGPPVRVPGLRTRGGAHMHTQWMVSDPT